MISGPIWGKIKNSNRFYFLRFQKSLQTVTVAMNEKMFASWKESYDKSKQTIAKQRHHFANKVPSSQSCGFSSSQVQM